MNGRGSKLAIVCDRNGIELAVYDIHEKSILMERAIFFSLLSTIVTAVVCFVPDTRVKGMVSLVTIFELLWCFGWRVDDDYHASYASANDVKEVLKILGTIVVINLLVRNFFSDVVWYLNLALATLPITFVVAFWPPDLKVKSFDEFARERWPNGFLQIDGGDRICLKPIQRQ